MDDNGVFWLLLLGVGAVLGGVFVWTLVTKAPSTQSTDLAQATASSKVTYKNVEEWEILRDSRGRTQGIRVHRTATEG